MKYDLEIESLLGLARAARELERNTTSTDNYSSTDHLMLLATAFTDRTCTLIELILDHEERAADFRQHWKRWRRVRGSRGFEPEIPRIEGRDIPAIPVLSILDQLARGASEQTVLTYFPTLRVEHVREAIRFALDHLRKHYRQKGTRHEK